MPFVVLFQAALFLLEALPDLVVDQEKELFLKTQFQCAVGKAIKQGYTTE